MAHPEVKGGSPIPEKAGDSSSALDRHFIRPPADEHEHQTDASASRAAMSEERNSASPTNGAKRSRDSSDFPSIIKQMEQRREWQETTIQPDRGTWDNNKPIFSERDRERNLEDLFGFHPPAGTPDLNRQLEKFRHVQTENQTLIGHQTEIYQALRLALDQTLAIKGIDPSTYDFEILRTREENAFIYHHQQIERPIICITSTLILNMQRYLGELKQGHLAMIFGHEIGHAIEGHYIQANPVENQEYPDPLKVRMDFSLDNLFSIPAAAIFSRSQEYKADEHGIDAVIASGYPADEGLEVLQYLASRDQRHAAKSDRSIPQSFREQTTTIELLKRAATTHPPILSRVAHGKGYVKVLESYETETVAARSLPSAPVSMEADTFAELNQSPTQLLLENMITHLNNHRLPYGLSTEGLCDMIGISHDAGVYKGAPDDPSQLRHLLLLVPALYRMSHGHLPFIPFDSISPEPVNKNAPPSEGFIGGAVSIDSLVVYLRNSTEKAIRAEAEKSGWSAFVTELAVFTDCASIYPSNRYNTQLGRLIELANEDPAGAVTDICRHGVRCFNLKSLPQNWIAGLSNSHSSETSDSFTQLQNEESCDLRVNLIRLLLTNGVLDDADAETIVSFAAMVDQNLRNDPAYHDARLDCELGQAITFAVEEWEKEDQLDLVIQLYERLPPEPSRADFVSVEVLRNLREIDLEEKSSFLEDNFPPGIQRDIMIAEILETLVFDHVSGPAGGKRGESISPQLLSQEGCDSLIAQLDLSWRKHTVSYLPAPIRQDDSDKKNITDGRPDFIESATLYYYAICAPLNFDSQPTRESQIIDKLGELLLAYHVKSAEPTSEDRIEAISTWHTILQSAEGKAYFEDGPKVLDGEYWDENLNSQELKDLLRCHPDSATIRAVLLDLSNFYTLRPDQYNVHPFTDRSDLDYFALPSGPILDSLILRNLAYQLLYQKPRENDLQWEERIRSLIEQEVPRRLAQLSAVSLQANDSASLSSSFLSHAELNGKVGTLYDRYSSYLAEQFGFHLVKEKFLNSGFTPPTLSSVAQEVGIQALNYFRDTLNPGQFEQLSAREMLELVKSYLVGPGYNRDIELNRIMLAAEKEAGSIQALIADPLSREIYDLLATSPYRAKWGKEIYQFELAHHPERYQTFDTHLELLLSTHPPQSAARDNALRRFFDGSADSRSLATSWEHYDQVREALTERDSHSSQHSSVYREAGLHIVKELLQDLEIPPRDYAHTVLWFVGLKDESHLIRCYQAASNENVAQLKEESARLTAREREELIYDILAGSKGILRTLKGEVRQEFMDTIFYTIFSDHELRETDTIKSFKAIFDTMMFHAEPERAAQILGKFLTALHEGKGFDYQAKLFFESFGFVGIKTAQFLVSNTNLLPERLQHVLMDLTSRVEGPDKRVIFEGLERQFGTERARELVQSIGERIGGGSLMSFYDVTLNGDPPRSGVIGMMRSDIVAALPEDIELVRRVIQTMTERPGIFGSFTVTEKLYDNLIWQSQLETDLARTRNIHAAMREEIHQFCAQNPGMSVDMPFLWREQSLKSGICALDQGPFIFMDKARGVTLDRFIEKCREEGDAGVSQLSEVHARLGALIGFQLSRGSVLHCDLHPGNILVDTSSGTTKLSILDAGLSVELEPVIQQNIRRIFAASLTQQQPEDMLDQIKARLYGVGKISDKVGLEWTEDLLRTLEILNSRTSDKGERERTAGQLWKALSNTDISFRERLYSTIDILEESLDLKLPRDMYGVLRALGVSQHIFEGIDKNTAAAILRPIVIDARGRASLEPVNWKVFETRLVAVLEQLGIDHAAQKVNQERKALLAIKSPLERLDYINSFAETLDSARAAEIKERILSDVSIQRALGISDLIHYFEKARSEQQADAQLLSQSFVASSKLPPGRAKEVSLDNNFGQISNPWRKMILPGSLIQLQQGRVSQLYRICYYDPNYEPAERSLVKPIEGRTALDYTPILIEGRDATHYNRVKKTDAGFVSTPQEIEGEEKDDLYESFAYEEIEPERASDAISLQTLLETRNAQISIMEDGVWIPFEQYRWNFQIN